MPLQPGSSQKVIGKNISELHQGPNYAQTAAKHGKAVADRQAVAIALAKSRDSFGNKKPHQGRHYHTS